MTQHLADDQLVGHTLQGIYEIEERVAQGGTAWIYRAKHKKLGGRVAVKILFRSFSAQDKARKRFLREAQLQYQLQHPHIVRVIDFIEDRGLLGFVMEWCEGMDLNDWLKERPKPHPSEWMPLIFPILDALGYAHQQGVVHRDLKPQNILLFPQQNQTFLPKLSDFGLAKNDDISITQSGTFLGTIAYLSPEQLQHSKSADALSDIYSFGVMLYQLCTGVLPFTGDMHSVMFRIIAQDPPPPSNVSPALQEIILRCLDKDPARRYPSTRSLLDALQEATSFHTPPPFSYETDEPLTDVDVETDGAQLDSVELSSLEGIQGDLTYIETKSGGDQTYIEVPQKPLPHPSPIPSPAPLSFAYHNNAKTEPIDFPPSSNAKTEPIDFLAPLSPSYPPSPSETATPHGLDRMRDPILKTPPPQNKTKNTTQQKEPSLPDNPSLFKDTVPSHQPAFTHSHRSSSGHLSAQASPIPQNARSGVRSALRHPSHPPAQAKRPIYLWVWFAFVLLLGLVAISVGYRASLAPPTQTKRKPSIKKHTPPLTRMIQPIKRPPKEAGHPKPDAGALPEDETWQWPPKDFPYRGPRLPKQLVLIEPTPSNQHTEFAQKLMSLQHKCNFRKDAKACTLAAQHLFPLSKQPKQRSLLLPTCQFAYRGCSLQHEPACTLLTSYLCNSKNLRKLRQELLQEKKLPAPKRKQVRPPH